MTTRTISTLALAGTFALALTGSAFAGGAGGGTELPSSAKKAETPSQSGSPANQGNNGGAGQMKGDPAMKGGESGSMQK